VLLEHARTCRVESVVRPYLEAVPVISLGTRGPRSARSSSPSGPLLGFLTHLSSRPTADLSTGTNIQRPFRLFSAGNSFATGGFLLASFGFRGYVANFASYDATYGGLGAAIVLMVWLFSRRLGDPGRR
jgi:Virulence factor BrkB